MYEDDREYASKRLVGTLIRNPEGRPFEVLDITEGDNDTLGAHGRILPEDVIAWYPLSEVILDPVPLGFVNSGRGMVFTCRKPMRKDWKQGLSSNSLQTYGHLRPNEVSFSQLTQPILRTYPSFARTLTDVSKRGSIAFSRDFGISTEFGDLALIYRKYVVGFVDQGQPVLHPNKIFLQQHLDEVV
jgi:hypothetical protein